MTATRPLPGSRVCRVGLAAVCLALALTALSPAPAAAQDATGTWIAYVDLGSDGGGQVTLVLEQAGSAVSGTYSGSYGALVALSGTTADGRIAFSFPGGDVGEIAYDGVLGVDTMWGDVTYGTRISGTFGAYRRPPATIVSTLIGYGVLALILLGAIGLIVASRSRR